MIRRRLLCGFLSLWCQLEPGAFAGSKPEQRIEEAAKLLADGKAIEAARIYISLRRPYGEYRWHTLGAEGLQKCVPLLKEESRSEAALLLPSALLYAKEYRAALEAGMRVPKGVGNPDERALMLYETGEAARVLCRWDEAIQLFERAARDTPDPDPDLALRARREMAFCYEARGEVTRAKKLYDSILKDFSAKSQRHYRRYLEHRLAMIEKYHGKDAAARQTRRVAHLPMSVHSLAATPDGRAVAGGCWDAMLYVYDPKSRQLTGLGRPVADKDGYKVRAMTTGPDGVVYGGTMGFYRAHLFAYDPNRDWNPGTTKQSNPRDLGLIPERQIGVLAVAAAENGRVYAASIDDSYTLKTEPHAGAFFYWDPQKEKIINLGEAKLFAPGGLCRSYALCVGPKGQIYGGGGDNLLLVYAPTVNRFFTRTLPTPGTVRRRAALQERVSNVNALVPGVDGLVYGGTMFDYHLFAYDPVKDTTADRGRQVDQGASSYHPGLVRGENGTLYGSTSWTFYRYDPRADRSEVLGELDRAEGMVTFMAANPLGGAYAACYTSHLSKARRERRAPSAIYWVGGKAE